VWIFLDKGRAAERRKTSGFLIARYLRSLKRRVVSSGVIQNPPRLTTLDSDQSGDSKPYHRSVTSKSAFGLMFFQDNSMLN
jgi:hypothetical protein